MKMQMFNVQLKTDRKPLVYHTNQTKRLIVKLKRKPLSSPVSVKAVRWKGWGLWWEGFKEKVPFEFRVERVGVMDSEVYWIVWGWQTELEYRFQRYCDAYQNKTNFEKIVMPQSLYGFVTYLMECALTFTFASQEFPPTCVCCISVTALIGL